MQDVQQSVSDDLQKQKNRHKLIQLDQLMMKLTESAILAAAALLADSTRSTDYRRKKFAVCY